MSTNANMIWHLKVSVVKFAMPFLKYTVYLKKVMYRGCQTKQDLFEYSGQIFIWSPCLTYHQHADTLRGKVRHKSDLLSNEGLLYSTLTLSYTKVQKFFDGTKRINAKVQWVTAANT